MNKELLERLRSAQGLLLLLDFDGTLVDIAQTPDSIVLAPEFKILLRKLLERPLTHVAIISGRSLEELTDYIPPSIPIALSGCHGCEIQMPGELELCLLDDDELQLDLEEFALSLEDLKSWPGILVENKGCSVAMHYRLADEITAERAQEEFYARAEMIISYDDMEFVDGKKVLELRPRGINKGIAVKFFSENFLPSKQATVVYFGDDTTDLEAFQALLSNSIRVAVGSKIGIQADYVLDSPAVLLDLIRRLVS